MTTRRRSPARSRSRAPRARTEWLNVRTAPVTVGSGLEVFSVLDADLTDKAGCTVLRLIWGLTIKPTILNGSAFGAFGTTMVGLDVSGGAGVPDPATDAQGWHLWSPFAVIDTDLSGFLHMGGDIRTARKYASRDHRYIFVYQDDGVSSSGVSNMQFTCRMLIRLP